MPCYIMRKETEELKERGEITEVEYLKRKKEMDEHEKIHILLEKQKEKGKVKIHA